jgi:hypothetical protein
MLLLLLLPPSTHPDLEADQLALQRLVLLLQDGQLRLRLQQLRLQRAALCLRRRQRRRLHRAGLAGD